MPDDAGLEITRTPELATRSALPVTRTALGTFTIAPQNMGELIEFAKLMSVSGQCVRPAFRGNPGACLAVALQAFRCGGDPFAWANKAYIVNDQLAYEAQLIHSLVNSSNALQRRLRPVYEGEGASRRCRIVGWIKGETEPLEYESPTVGSITVKNSPLWKSDPDQQLFYFSSRAWARRHLPEVLLGMYAPEEFETIDATPQPGEPSLTKLERFETAYGDEPAAAPAQSEPKPFIFVDTAGEVYEYERPGRATTRYLGLLREPGGEDAIEDLWEKNGAFLSALREHGRADLADGLSKECGALLAKARAEAAARAQADTMSRLAESQDDKRATPAPSASPAPPSPPASPAAPETERLVPRAAPAPAPTPDVPNLEIPMVTLRQGAQLGQPDYRRWVLVLFLPKLLQQTDTFTLAHFLGQNEAHREGAKAAGFRQMIEEAEAAQWQVVDAR